MHKIIVYGFPFILMSFEWILRTLVKVDTSGFIGPTLSATGISFMVPLTKLKTKELITHDDKWEMVSKSDKNFVNLVWLSLFIALFVWFWACKLSLQDATTTFFSIPSHVALGICLYLFSILLSAIKEVI